jgi:hypothetical protein
VSTTFRPIVREQPVAVGVDHGVDAVAQVEFGQDPGDVGLDGFVSDVEVATDLDVAVAGGNEQQHLVLPGGERSSPGARAAVVSLGAIDILIGIECG